MPSKSETAPTPTTPAQPERRQLAPEDMALLMALKAEIDSHHAVIRAIEHTHTMVLNGLRTRYGVMEADGWQFDDYVIGFTRESADGKQTD